MKRVVIVSVYFVLLIGVVSALPVFPGAEGFGSETRAAYGGTGNPNIYVVNTLADNTIAPTMGTINGVTVYKGSLRACLADTAHTTTGKGRVILFGVSGYINLNSRLDVSYPYTSILGQTAPSPGIALKGNYILIKTHDVLLQHVRTRVGGIGTQGVANIACDNLDGFEIENYNDPNGVYNIVADHISIAWSSDEAISIWYNAHDITISNSIVSEPLDVGCHTDKVTPVQQPAVSHGYSFITADHIYNVSVLRNLFAHGYQRHPLQHYGSTTIVWQNNVMYDYYLGAQIGDGDLSSHPVSYDIIENKYITGPTVGNYYPIQLIALGDSSNSHIYLSGNVEDDPTPHSPIYTCDEGCSEPAANYLDGSPWNSLNLTTLDAADNGPNGLEEVVKATAGARPANRDNVDTRDVADVTDGTGGLINWQTDLGSDGLGGYQTLASNTNTFTDLPASPHADDDGDGYTNLEEWIHSYSCDVEGPQSLSCLASPPTCSEWKITSTCLCGSVEYSSGYCCSGGVWQSTTCPAKTTIFSSINYFGDSDNWEPLNSSRWDVVNDGNNLRYGIITTDYSSLSVSRLGEYSLVKGKTYTDFNISAKAKSTDDFGLNPSADYAVVFGYKDSNNYYYIMFSSYSGNTELFKVVNGIRETINSTSFAVPDNNYHDIKVEKSGSSIKVYFDNALVSTASDSTFVSGRIGIGSFNDAVLWDDVAVNEVSGSICNSLADANIDGQISISELINYISQWKQGSVTIGNLIDAIGKWKSGC